MSDLEILCGICSTKSEPFGVATVLNKYPVRYGRCPSCGFMQTEPAFWLKEAYGTAITRKDIGYAKRNIDCVKVTKAVIRLFLDPAERFVDFGGGYGLFVRLMRDDGFDFYRFDPFCENLFALGFDVTTQPNESSIAPERFELLTAFEVAEHLEKPLDSFKTMLGFSDNIFFGTTLISMSPPPLDSWWYYGLDHGQHVAFYTHESLRRLAAKFDLNLVTDGAGFHLLSKARFSEGLFRFMTRHRKLTAVLNALSKRPSLLEDDFAKLATSAGSREPLISPNER